MKRVLRITAGIMGLWLILGVGGLAIVRAHEKPQPLMLVVDDTRNKESIYVAGFRSRLRQKLMSDYFLYNGRGWSPDGEWFYLVGLYVISDFGHDGLWRINRDGRRIEQLDGMEFPPTATWDMDGQSFLYAHQQVRDEASGLIRLNPDTGLAENLTPHLGVNPKVPFPECAIVATTHWIYFCAGPADVTFLYQLGRDSQLLNLTPHMDWPTGLMAHDENEGWLVLRSLGALFILDAGNSEPQPLFPERLDGKSIISVRWLPTWDVLIVEVTLADMPILYGFDMTNRRLLWQQAGMRLITITPDNWLVATSPDADLLRMRPDGTALAQIVAGVDYRSYVGVSPDNQWLLYSHVNVDTYAYTLWRVPLMGGKPRIILHISSAKFTPQLRDWSPDQQWMLLIFSNGLSSEQKWVKLDGSEVRPLVEWGDAQFLTWLGPLNRHWQPIALIGLGAALEIGYIGWPKKRRLRRV